MVTPQLSDHIALEFSTYREMAAAAWW